LSDILHTDLIEDRGYFTLGDTEVSPWDLYLDLFVNDEDFACDTASSDLTICSAPGYEAVSAPFSDWVVTVTDCVFTATAGPYYIELTGPGSPGQTIYGHVVHNGEWGTGVALAWGLTWATPYVIPSNGATLQINLSWTDEECPDSGLRVAKRRVQAEVVQQPAEGQRRRRKPQPKKNGGGKSS